MGTLYLDRRNLSLRLDGKRLVIEEPDARPRGVPLAMVERVVLQGQVQFDSGFAGLGVGCAGCAGVATSCPQRAGTGFDG